MILQAEYSFCWQNTWLILIWCSPSISQQSRFTSLSSFPDTASRKFLLQAKLFYQRNLIAGYKSKSKTLWHVRLLRYDFKRHSFATIQLLEAWCVTSNFPQRNIWVFGNADLLKVDYKKYGNLGLSNWKLEFYANLI